MSAERLFISHASEDAETVNAIVAYLEARGIACWIASRDIPPRSIYAEAITEGIETCSACAVVVSAASNASDAVKRELELASHYKKPFIPIRIDATEPGRGLAYYLRNAQWIDYRREGERALNRIAGRDTGASVASPIGQQTPARSGSQAVGAPVQPPSRMLTILTFVLVFGLGLWGVWSVLRSASPDPSKVPPTEFAVSEDPPPPPETTGPTSLPVEPAANSTEAERAQREARLPQSEWIRRVRSERIVPGDVLAGVRVGMSASDVLAVLGQPDENLLPVPAESRSRVMRYGNAPLELVIVFREDDRVEWIHLLDEQRLMRGLMRGVNGVGIGNYRRQAITMMGVEPEGDYGGESCYDWGTRGVMFGGDSRGINAISVYRAAEGSGCA